MYQKPWDKKSYTLIIVRKRHNGDSEETYN